MANLNKVSTCLRHALSENKNYEQEDILSVNSDFVAIKIHLIVNTIIQKRYIQSVPYIIVASFKYTAKTKNKWFKLT